MLLVKTGSKLKTIRVKLWGSPNFLIERLLSASILLQCLHLCCMKEYTLDTFVHVEHIIINIFIKITKTSLICFVIYVSFLTLLHPYTQEHSGWREKYKTICFEETFVFWVYMYRKLCFRACWIRYTFFTPEARIITPVSQSFVSIKIHGVHNLAT